MLLLFSRSAARQLIEALDAVGFAAYLKRTRNTICGRHPIAVLLNAIQHKQQVPMGRAERGARGAERGARRGSDVAVSVMPARETGSGMDQRQPRPLRVRLKFAHYAQSSRVTAPTESSVSYASAFAQALP